MRWRFILSLFFGALLPLAFAPFNLYSVAFFAPAFLLHFLQKSTPKQAVLLGFIFGVGFFGVGISWIFISIHYFGNTSKILAGFMTLCVVCLMALHYAILGYLFKKFFGKKSLLIQCLLAFPALWVTVEIINTAILGFPWLLLGYSQMTTPLKGLAPIVGVYGLSLCITLISGALVLLAKENRFKTHLVCFSVIIILISTGFVFREHTWTKVSGQPFKVSLIQGNIPQSIKWQPEYALENINVYKHLTLRHLDSKLIVWPEGAIPVIAEDIPQFIDQLGLLAKKHDTTILFGAPSQNKADNKYYNAIFMVGDDQGKYLKRKLVPYGEYTPMPWFTKPLAKKFNLALSDISEGPENQPPLKFNGITIAPFICYEVTFPRLVLNTAENSQLLLTVSDDSWFGKSIALTQHLQMAKMRALETGRYMLLATNTGITAIISPLGKMINGAPIDKQAVISGDVTAMTGKTPLMIWRYYPIYALIILMMLAGLLTSKRQRSKP